MRALVPLLLLTRLAFADAGLLLPGDKKQPDPAWLSLEEMTIDIHIDNGHARVSTRQIFANHQSTTLEGTYIFALPGGAIVGSVREGMSRSRYGSLDQVPLF